MLWSNSKIEDNRIELAMAKIVGAFSWIKSLLYMSCIPSNISEASSYFRWPLQIKFTERCTVDIIIGSMCLQMKHSLTELSFNIIPCALSDDTSTLVEIGSVLNRCEVII